MVLYKTQTILSAYANLQQSFMGLPGLTTPHAGETWLYQEKLPLVFKTIYAHLHTPTH